jgi:glycosyltransferase involved in cell wall biosynthesis
MITNATSRRKPYQSFFDFLFIKPALTRANCVIALQAIEQESLVKTFGCSNIEILPNGVNFQDFSDYEPRDNKLVVFVSRLHPQKDPLVFVKVAQRMLKKGVSLKFEVAGSDGGLEAEVVRQIENTNSDQLKFLGSLGNKEVRSIFRRACVLVLPSKDDQYPMVILEAAACGLQVILSSSSALAPTISKNKLGITCEPTIDNLEQSILDAIAHPIESSKIIQIASEIFNISSVVKSLTAIYTRRQHP